MDEQTRQEIRAALQQRAEADRILGASAWPIARAVLTRTGAVRTTPPAKPQSPRTSAPQSRPPVASAPAAAAAQRAPSNAARPTSGPPTSAVRPPAPDALHAAGATGLRPAAADLPADATAERRRKLDLLDKEHVRSCTRCGLCETRTRTVFGQGHVAPRIVFVGEAPGFDEDRSGLAFVGRAGKLLTDMIELGMRISRDDVFICNVLKCRPPDNRTPAPDEIAACSPYLWEQLRVLRPEVIVALGAPAAQTLLETREPIGKLRGRFHDLHLPGTQLTGEPPIPLMPTFHPAYLLRSPGEKGKAWADLKMVLEKLGLEVPGKAG